MEHRQDTSGNAARTGRRWRVPALLIASVLLGTAITFGVAAPSASAADTSATLTATGVVSGTYPTGGNTIWVQPGTSLTLDSKLLKVNLSQSILGDLGDVLGNLLGGLVGLQAKADLSSVRLGSVTLGVGGKPSVTTPTLGRGVYPFTWTFSAVTSGLLGQQTVALNGNQLAGIGLKLNAKNQYVGYIVADTASPCAGATCVSIQTPTLSVAPSLPVVGQLPTVTVPGQNVTIPVPGVPGVNEPLPGQSGSGTPGGGSSSTAPAPGSSTSTTTTNPYGYKDPGCTGPCVVVPRGGGGGGTVGGASGVTLGELGGTGTTSGSSGGGGSDDPAANAIADGADRAGGSAALGIDRAFAGTGPNGSSLPGLPTTLTIVAVAALAGSTVLWFARRRLARG